MGTKHKHYDVIVAWAAGEEIEFWGTVLNEWFAYKGTDTPAFEDYSAWRIKPKRVKKEGWVNVYGYGCLYNSVWESKEKADIRDDELYTKRIACVHVIWEEEE